MFSVYRVPWICALAVSFQLWWEFSYERGSEPAEQ